MNWMSNLNVTDIEPQYDVLDELMGNVPEEIPQVCCSMCCFPITVDRPLHEDAGICVNCFTQINNGDFSLGNSNNSETDILSCCVLCANKISERVRIRGTDICSSCMTMLKEGNFELDLNENDSNDQSSVDNRPTCEDSEAFIDAAYDAASDIGPGKQTDYKESLMASLYSQVEFLREQVMEEKKTNRDLIKCIMSMRGINRESLPQKVSFSISTSRSSSVSELLSDEGENEEEKGSETLPEQPLSSQQQQKQQQQQQQQKPKQPQQQKQQQQHVRLPPKRAEEQLRDYAKRKHAAFQEEKASKPSFFGRRS